MFVKKIRNLDDPKTTEQYHALLIRNKPFLKKIYISFYTQFKEKILSSKKGTIVELGSGGGFIKEIIPNVITSDVMKLDTVDMHFSALNMPFKDETIDGFVMIDVMHHVPDVKKLFTEMNRCLKKGSKIIMIEPANTIWSKIIYRYFHHELFDPKGQWSFKSIGPLSSSNLALPWIVFFRDKEIFNQLFPNLTVKKVIPHTPFLYLLSGGLSFPQIVPSWTYQFIIFFEKLLKHLNPHIGMFYTIEIIKK